MNEQSDWRKEVTFATSSSEIIFATGAASAAAAAVMLHVFSSPLEWRCVVMSRLGFNEAEELIAASCWELLAVSCS